MSKYILVLRNSHKKMKVIVEGKNYLFYANSLHEIFYRANDDFNLKEKLYILNYPLEVVWIPISDVHYDFLRAFYSLIKPKQLVIKPVDGKVIINVNKFL